MDNMVYIIVRRDNENGVNENFKVFLNEDNANECLSSLEEEFENVYCDSGFYKYEFFIEQHEIEERRHYTGNELHEMFKKLQEEIKI